MNEGKQSCPAEEGKNEHPTAHITQANFEVKLERTSHAVEDFWLAEGIRYGREDYIRNISAELFYRDVTHTTKMRVF